MVEFKYGGQTVIVVNKNLQNDIPNLEKIRKILPSNPTIVDCGANYGNHTIYYVKFMNAKKVYVFEPIKKIYDVMLEVLNINKIDNVDVYNMGVSAKHEEIQLVSMIPENKGSFAFWYKGEEIEKKPYEMGFKKHIDANHLIAHSVPLDDMINEKIDFIKIDVEGMEMEVLKGAKRLINEYSPLILIEVWGRNKTNKQKLKKWMEKNNYISAMGMTGPNHLIKEARRRK